MVEASSWDLRLKNAANRPAILGFWLGNALKLIF
jgi:hypothetical protein